MDRYDQPDAVMAAARAVLARQRDMGFNPRALAKDERRSLRRALRRESRALRREDRALRRMAQGGRGPGRLVWLVLGVALAIMLAGVVITGLLLVGAVGLLAALAYALLRPREKATPPPSAQELAKAPLPQLADQTRHWLAGQMALLPPAALPLADELGLRLEALSPVLAAMPADHPGAAPLRALLGEHLPELVGAYTAVPAPLRAQPHLGATPDDTLTQGLGRINAELQEDLGALASGALDRLAVQGRYLDYRYGGAEISQE